MFSTELTIRRRGYVRRLAYAGLTAAALAALSAGLARALPVIEVNDRWLQRAPWGQIGLWAGSIVCLIGAMTAILAHHWRSRVLGHDSLQSIRWLTPREFNRLVAEGFRRQGYLVQASEGSFSRSGIDLLLRKGENHVLVLCRRDPEPRRQLAAVQELHAAIATVHGASGLLITSETIAVEAKTYAGEQGIAVIEGPALLKLVQRARGDNAGRIARREPHFAVPLTDLPVCRSCGGPLIPGADHDHDPEMRGWQCARGASCQPAHVA